MEPIGYHCIIDHPSINHSLNNIMLYVTTSITTTYKPSLIFNIPHIILTISDTIYTILPLWSANYVLDPMLTPLETSISNSRMFGKHFYIPIQQQCQTLLYLTQTTNKLLVTYSLHPYFWQHPYLMYDSDTIIYHIFPCFPNFKLQYAYMDILHELSSIFDNFYTETENKSL